LGIRDWGLPPRVLHCESTLVAGVAVGLVLLALVVTACGRQPAVCAVNGGFEGGWHRGTAYWTVEGGPFDTEFGEIFTPEGWVTWWREGFDCAGTSGWVLGRPEVKVITRVPDRARVRSGEHAVQWFTFWRCHEGGLYQRVPAVVGQRYSARAFGHSWYSRCSTKPHGPPLEADCETRIWWAQDWLSVGIDPTGGVDPLAATVVWGEEREIYGGYDEAGVEVRGVVAEGESVTVFLRSEASHPLKHNDVYWDDVAVWAEYVVYLPVVRVGN